jgi:hypothetical protein
MDIFDQGGLLAGCNVAFVLDRNIFYGWPAPSAVAGDDHKSDASVFDYD